MSTATGNSDKIGGILTVTRTVNVLFTSSSSGSGGGTLVTKLPTTFVIAPSSTGITNSSSSIFSFSALSSSSSNASSLALLSPSSTPTSSSRFSSTSISSWGIGATQSDYSNTPYNPTWLILATIIIGIVLLSVGGWLLRRCLIRQRMATMSRLPDVEDDTDSFEKGLSSPIADVAMSGMGMGEKTTSFPTLNSQGSLGRKATKVDGGVASATDSFYAPEWTTPAPPHTHGTVPAPLPILVPLPKGDVINNGRNVPEPLLARAPTPPEPFLARGPSPPSAEGWAVGVATTTSMPVSSTGKSAVSTTAYPPPVTRIAPVVRSAVGTSGHISSGSNGSKGALTSSASSSSTSERHLVGARRAEIKSTGESNVGRLMLEPSFPDPQEGRMPGQSKLAPPVMDSSRLSADFVPLSQMAHLTRQPSYRSPTESIYGCYNES